MHGEGLPDLNFDVLVHLLKMMCQVIKVDHCDLYIDL